MPVNDFASYPMAWRPDKRRLWHPIYLSLATQLEQDIGEGRLPENTRLPPQRELADFLDLNLSTITRAYRHCVEKGLLYAVVGRGTYVSPHIHAPASVLRQHTHAQIELGTIQPYHQDNGLICEVARGILAAPSAEQYFDYRFPLGSPSQREVARGWLAMAQVEAPAENIIITPGTQNALSIVLASLFQVGDRIATDCYTYPNFISLANMLGIQLVPVRSDEQGMSPAELQKLCRTVGIKGLYLMPSCSNPTSFCIGPGRRGELAGIVRQEGLVLIEDDSYAFLSEEAFAPMAALAPERSIFISGLSKPISAGLRIAYMAFPTAFQRELEKGFYSLNFKTPSFNTEIATEIIRSNLWREILCSKRERSLERNQVYAQVLGELAPWVHPGSYFQWLPLPKRCSGRAFEALAAEKGVCVYGSERFSVGGVDGGYFIRIATASPTDAEELRRGLELVKSCYLELGPKDVPYII